MWVGLIKSVERPSEPHWGSPKEKKGPLWTVASACPSGWPALQISDLLTQHPQPHQPVPCNTSLHMYVLEVLFLWLNADWQGQTKGPRTALWYMEQTTGEQGGPVSGPAAASRAVIESYRKPTPILKPSVLVPRGPSPIPSPWDPGFLLEFFIVLTWMYLL